MRARWTITYAYTHADQYAQLDSKHEWNTNSYGNRHADSNSKPKQHTASYSYSKVSPDAATAAHSSATPNGSPASAVAPTHGLAATHAGSSSYTAADSIFAAAYPRATAIELLPNNCVSQALCNAVIRCGEGDRKRHTRKN